MNRITVKGLLLILAAVTIIFWGVGIPLFDYLPGDQPASVDLFRVLNPLAIAMGISVVVTWLPALIDTMKKMNYHVNGAQILVAAGVLNWVGMLIRMARWYVWGEVPNLAPWNETNAVARELWLYNFGLWMSILGGGLLITAVDISFPDIKFRNLKKAAITIGMILAIALLYIEFAGIPPLLVD